MNRKKILVWILTLLVVGGASGITYASEKMDTTKNVVAAAENKNNSNALKQGTMNDEEAIKIAAEAMKNYMGKDANYFSQIKVDRSADIAKETQQLNKKDEKEGSEGEKKFEEIREKYSKEHPEDAKVEAENMAKAKDQRMIYILFTPKNYDENKMCNYSVSIDEKTGEIVGVRAENDSDKDFKPAIVDNRIKDTTLNFCKKIGNKIKGNTIKVDKNINFGRLLVRCELDDGRDAEFEINLKDYSVVYYQLQSIKLLPSMKKDLNNQIRQIEIN
ncbi:hypothetical protein [Clostridium coskatii]|uniref:PepSY domain-containing protein n=1 Tax=Clostridium coskatii TaxID=1705578 RepID=A0A162JHF5_9CLOT|nr:hypothetical protein [Clostridium coskatii]OAA95115.1 hypothetical protein WX73_01524 [Clostridium coskatii]OBR97537.1 hypothetical protein CLCOS_02520 [Clostridium coskatii]